MTDREEPPPIVGVGRGRARGASPFADVVPTLRFAAAYAVAIALWLAVGDELPGGRWLAVHLFTLGVLTNVILAFSEHFTRAITRSPGTRPGWWTWITNLGIVLLLAGLPTRWVPGLALGATIVIGVVAAAWWRLRRLRRRAVGARLGWVARRYEDAHLFFLVGATLGTLLGLGVSAGAWTAGMRVAHLHANVLGWGVLTLLATLVFFGPTMARCQIEPGADRAAARALRLGAIALAVGLVLLLSLGLPGAAGTVARVGAGLALAGFAVAATVVTAPVWRAVWRARVTAARPLILGAVAWLTLAVWADAAVVGLGGWRWLDAVGLVALSGVLAPAILATVVYLVPMLRGRTTGERELLRIRLEVGARTRALALNLGVLAVGAGTAWQMAAGPGADTWPVAGLGWGLIATVVGSTLIVGLWSMGRPGQTPRAHTDRAG